VNQLLPRKKRLAFRYDLLERERPIRPLLEAERAQRTGDTIPRDRSVPFHSEIIDSG
jgi:hypothetical protein